MLIQVHLLHLIYFPLSQWNHFKMVVICMNFIQLLKRVQAPSHRENRNPTKAVCCLVLKRVEIHSPLQKIRGLTFIVWTYRIITPFGHGNFSIGSVQLQFKRVQLHLNEVNFTSTESPGYLDFPSLFKFKINETFIIWKY